MLSVFCAGVFGAATEKADESIGWCRSTSCSRTRRFWPRSGSKRELNRLVVLGLGIWEGWLSVGGCY